MIEYAQHQKDAISFQQVQPFSICALNTGTGSINFYSKLNKETIKMACIYKCTRLSDNKVVYVGLTIYTLEFRLHGEPFGHFLLAFEKNSQTYFHKALRKYGKDAFKFEVIEEREDSEFTSKEDMHDWLNKREKYWIAHYDTFNTGYNQTTGGHDFYHRSDKNKRVISETTKRAMAKYNTKELCNPTKNMTEEEKLTWKSNISKRTKEEMAKFDTKKLCNPKNGRTQEQIDLWYERNKIAHSGRVWIHRGSERHLVKKENVQLFIEQGFAYGRNLYSNSTKGKIWVNNGDRQHLIKPEDIQIFIDTGYVKGRIKRR